MGDKSVILGMSMSSGGEVLNWFVRVSSLVYRKHFEAA